MLAECNRRCYFCACTADGFRSCLPRFGEVGDIAILVPLLYDWFVNSLRELEGLHRFELAMSLFLRGSGLLGCREHGDSLITTYNIAVVSRGVVIGYRLPGRMSGLL